MSSFKDISQILTFFHLRKFIECYYIKYNDFVAHRISEQRYQDGKAEVKIFRVFLINVEESMQEYFLLIELENENLGKMNHFVR